MPISTAPQSTSADDGARTARLEKELVQLKTEVASLLRSEASDEAQNQSILGWATMAMSVLGVLLGLYAVMRH